MASITFPELLKWGLSSVLFFDFFSTIRYQIYSVIPWLTKHTLSLTLSLAVYLCKGGRNLTYCGNLLTGSFVEEPKNFMLYAYITWNHSFWWFLRLTVLTRGHIIRTFFIWASCSGYVQWGLKMILNIVSGLTLAAKSCIQGLWKPVL